MIDDGFIKSLLEKKGSLSRRESIDCLTLDCPADQLKDVVLSFRDDEGFDLLVDLTAIDHGEDAEVRFSVVLHFYSLVHRGYVRLHVLCSDNENPSVPSVSDISPAANWHERETYDMFGIKFTGHPDLKRILMWDEYPYFPLRKEFPLAGIDTPLPAADVVEVTKASVEPAPMMGGPFVSSSDGVMSDSEPRALDESWTEEMEKPS
ncbi:MAG: NADH-quinone oxidoreductase subunit C [Opitutae bacterium]|nr:NADH-quinone oxidoreductase subunit C [Opitutae bacterium]